MINKSMVELAVCLKNHPHPITTIRMRLTNKMRRCYPQNRRLGMVVSIETGKHDCTNDYGNYSPTTTLLDALEKRSKQ
jgi:hypothetical protein